MAVEPMTVEGYMALHGPEPTARVSYGAEPSQYVEVSLPDGVGPHPVAVIIHGGCWHTEFEGVPQMRAMAGALLARGIAVWNVEYRRVEEKGGGYPGMFQDAAEALDALSAHADEFKLDTRRVVLIGHSAGGFLVRWLAGRALLPASSPLYKPHPFAVHEVIALGSAAGDLRESRTWLTNVCGVDIDTLTGAPSATRPDVFVDTSPLELTPNGSHLVLVNADQDRISMPSAIAREAKKVAARGDAVDVHVIDNGSHFDEVSPEWSGWPVIDELITRALGLTP